MFVFKLMKYLGVVGLVLAAMGPAHAKQASATTVPKEHVSSAGPLPPRAVERVIVWGFRVRPELFASKRPPLNAGYGAAVAKADCQLQVCAFVVFYDGSSWRVTSVQSGPEERLLTMREQIQGTDSVFVIVHPPANRLKAPYF